MDISEVKGSLNKLVVFEEQRQYVNARYLFTGCILRRNKKGLYYQAELTDMNGNSLIYTALEKITLIGGRNNVNGRTGAEDTVRCDNG